MGKYSNKFIIRAVQDTQRKRVSTAESNTDKSALEFVCACLCLRDKCARPRFRVAACVRLIDG